ncbi:hypothetical protein CPU12_08145 [Malaciobacter molluscorum LMG 25693]|uniref:Membrane protein n=1 Tax=Malaciobacter molluscorum LMG 25693 TaxID=870501 RepID=A0A2G1DHS8_9BACT|nr:hypothetical protein [Malaciobacter molluscorum]AXX93694.1 putative membrane protein [Malaciobacter molluscorum LMG 25693]PHO17896.1 hypothetical protein CPU12_08145 [Malaciobacter molluscorum LMG 25693]RXJ93629.1 hypothetical protein CRV00_10265 [Malaciobacter molluscorum]
MQKVALVLFIAFELCYYLLIAQTGIVEHFSSNIFNIAFLPIGGIIGSILSFIIKISEKKKIIGFLTTQLIVSIFYPNLNSFLLLILGFSVGALAPLLINELKKASNIQLGFALAISYTLGTFLFTYDASKRTNIAILFTIITLISSFFLDMKKHKDLSKNSANFPLFVMVLWIFLDSCLFETLSRDIDISIWRNGFSLEIAIFHIIGVVCAFYFKMERVQKELFIITLFALSYLFFFLHEPLILSIIYPFVISFYNVVILQTIVKKDLKTLGIYMIFIGWIASGGGLFVALGNLILYVPLIFFISLIKILITQIQNKEIAYV